MIIMAIILGWRPSRKVGAAQLVGAFRLGVRIDLVLFAGGLALLVFAQTRKSPALK